MPPRHHTSSSTSSHIHQSNSRPRAWTGNHCRSLHIRGTWTNHDKISLRALKGCVKGQMPSICPERVQSYARPRIDEGRIYDQDSAEEVCKGLDAVPIHTLSRH
jgi:hypothetical protein